MGGTGRLGVADSRDALVWSFRRMTEPRIFMPPVVVISLAQGLGLWLTSAAMKWTQEGAGVGPMPESAGPLWLLGMGILACAPAAVSGFMTLADRAMEGTEQGWRDVKDGAGKYYWRVAGGYILAFVAMSMLGWMAFGSFSSLDARQIRDVGSFSNVALWVVKYFVAAWLAAMAIDGAGILGSLAKSVRFAWAHPACLLPAFALQEAGSWLLDRLSSIALSMPGPLSSGVQLSPAGIPAIFALGAVSGWLYMLFMLVYFRLYRSSKQATATQPTEPGPAPEA